MKHCLLILFLLVVANGHGFAQKGAADSLRKILARPARDTAYFKAAARIAELFGFSKPDSALYYAGLVTTRPEETRLWLNLKQTAWNSTGYARYTQARYDDAIAAFRRFGEYASRLGLKRDFATSINNEGNIWIEKGDYATALQKYREALAVQESIGDANAIAMTYTNVGYIYKDIGDYEKAISNFLFALRQYEKNGDKKNIALTNTFLANVYTRNKDWERASEAARLSLKLYGEIEDESGTGVALQSLGNVYAEKGDYAAARPWYAQAVELYKKSGDSRQLAIVASNTGEILAREEAWAESLPYYEQAIAISTKSGNRRLLASYYTGAANANISLNRLAEARMQLDSATAITAVIRNKNQLKNLYEVEAKYFEATGELPRALKSSYLFSAQKDSLLNESNQKTMKDLSVKYETEKKETQIALLGKEAALQALQLQNDRLQINQQLFALAQNKLRLTEADLQIAQSSLILASQGERILTQQLDSTQRVKRLQEAQRQSELQALQLRNRALELRQRNAIIASLAIAILLGSMLAYSWHRRSRLAAAGRLQEVMRLQQEEAMSAVLQAEEGERQRIAKDLHDGVGQLMSAAKMNLNAYRNETRFETDDQQQSFDRVIALIDESCTEVRTVSHNLMPNALLKRSLASAIREFISQLDQRQLAVNLYTEGLDQRLGQDIEAVLYRVIQECVNNVIKHAGASALDISILKDEGELTATIEDNGRGFDAGKEGVEDGIGLKNIRARIQYLKGTVEWDSKPGRGTLVAIHLPLGTAG